MERWAEIFPAVEVFTVAFLFIRRWRAINTSLPGVRGLGFKILFDKLLNLQCHPHQRVQILLGLKSITVYRFIKPYTKVQKNILKELRGCFVTKTEVGNLWRPWLPGKYVNKM